MKILIEDYALNHIGGGQKFSCLMAEHLSQKHEVFLTSGSRMDKGYLQNFYGVDLSKVKLILEGELTGNYDLHIQAEHASWLPPRGKISILLCHIPAPNKPLTYIDDYDFIFCASEYARNIIKKHWNKESYITSLYSSDILPAPKERQILTVNRITHHKYLMEMIEQFRLRNFALRGWKLKIIGATGWNPQYDLLLKNQSDIPGISFLFNIPWELVEQEYARSSIYWHLGGLSKNEFEGESWSMTTAEAMSAGCYPLVPAIGGSSEVPPIGSYAEEYRVDDAEHLGIITESMIKDRIDFNTYSKSCIEHARNFKKKFWNNLQSFLKPLNIEL